MLHSFSAYYFRALSIKMCLSKKILSKSNIKESSLIFQAFKFFFP